MNVRNENYRLKEKHKTYEKVIALLEKYGIKDDDWSVENEVRKKLFGISRGLKTTINDLKRNLHWLEKELEALDE